MKIFNVLFPYEKSLPRGNGDESSVAAMYGDAPVKYEDIKGLQNCHPDKLRENLEAETKDAVTNAVKENRVDDINDLLTLQ
jgi:hypothetical protein